FFHNTQTYTKATFRIVEANIPVENILESKFTSLSGGQKHVVLIALNLVKKAKVLLLEL
ncbi:MAG TPA: ATP-binding cassette domain-containing protein, partial [Aquificae bacterium]|nr:ATP-binding cassette domain-containing protein [Aquificota bacterium]